MKITYDVLNIKDTKDKIVLFTPRYEFLKTPESKNVEIIAIYENNNFIVKEILHNGGNIIPLNGVIISYPENTTLELKNNDILEIENYVYVKYENSLLNNSGKRCVIHKYNGKHYNDEVALVDRGYSIFTLVYQNYYEMVLKLDSKVRGYVVSSLKHKEYSKMLGREIDKGSYVLLCNDCNNEFFTRFNENEEVHFEIPLVLENIDVSFKYTAYNPSPSKKENFDATYFAFRAPDTCMVYDINGFSVDKKTRLTGTNVWGYEIGVDEYGVVVDRNINVKVPENGYVISGVSDYRGILENQFLLGGKVIIDKENKMIYYHGTYMNSCLYQYKKMKDFVNSIFDKIKKLYDLNIELIEKYANKFKVLEEKLLQRKLMIENSFDHEREYHLQRFHQYFSKALDYYHQLYKLSIEPTNVEVRGCWHAATEKNLKEVEETLDTLKASNFNEILVGAMDKDGVIYKSKIFPFAKTTSGWFGDEYKEDYLACLVGEAKKRNIKVQVLVDNFFVAPLLLNVDYEKYSPFLAQDYNGKIGRRDYGEITLFLDPANDKVHDILLNMYKEILDNYDISGFQLDYIRYCIGNDSYLTAYGYNKESVDRFKEEYHYEGDIHELVKDSKIYEDFCEFRREGITSYVGKMKKMVSQYSNVQLTIAVVSEYEIAKASKLQDWPKWSKLGYIDGIYLMAYHLGDEPVYNDCISAKKLVGDHSYIVGGVAPIYNGSNINILLEQLNATKNAQVEGFALFAFHSFKGRPDLYYYFNNNGPYSKGAIPTYESKENVLNAYCNEVMDRYERIYKEFITKAEIEHFILQLKAVQEIADVDQIEYIAHPNVRIHLEEIKEKVKKYLLIFNKKVQ